MPTAKLINDREVERDYLLEDGKVITLHSSPWENVITFSENGKHFENAGFEFTDEYGGGEKYLLSGMFSPIKGAGLGRAALEFFKDITGAVIYADLSQGIEPDEETLITGDSLGFIAKMQEEGTIEDAEEDTEDNIVRKAFGKLTVSFTKGNIYTFKENFDSYLSLVSDEKAALELAELLMQNYSTYKSDAIATFLEIIIQKKPTLALINHPENVFYRLCLIKGSKDLFDCYIEESVIPFLANVNAEKHKIHFQELLHTAKMLTEAFYIKQPHYTKGSDYNGAFSNPQIDQNLLLIHRSDYEIMEGAIENLNAIVGRREILKDLIAKINLS